MTKKNSDAILRVTVVQWQKKKKSGACEIVGANSLLELIIYQLIYNHEKKCINSLDNRDPSNKSLS